MNAMNPQIVRLTKCNLTKEMISTDINNDNSLHLNAHLLYVFLWRRSHTMMNAPLPWGHQGYCCADGSQQRRTCTGQFACLPEHSISTLERLIWRDSLIQDSMSWRLRFSLVTEVECTFTAIFGQLQTQTRQILD